MFNWSRNHRPVRLRLVPPAWSHMDRILHTDLLHGAGLCFDHYESEGGWRDSYDMMGSQSLSVVWLALTRGTCSLPGAVPLGHGQWDLGIWRDLLHPWCSDESFHQESRQMDHVSLVCLLDSHFSFSADCVHVYHLDILHMHRQDR